MKYQFTARKVTLAGALFFTWRSDSQVIDGRKNLVHIYSVLTLRGGRMAYELFFRGEGWRALGLRMPRADWEAVPVTSPENSPNIEKYLGKKLRWHQPKTGKLGYGGCATVEKATDPVEVLFALHPRNVRDSMLTLSFLLQDIAR